MSISAPGVVKREGQERVCGVLKGRNGEFEVPGTEKQRGGYL